MVQPLLSTEKAHNEYHFVPSRRKTKSSPLTWPKNGPSLPPGLPGARLEARPPGAGCEPSRHFPPGTLQVEAKPGELVPDIFWGEHATAYHVRDRGLVIISSCGHAGIINSIRQIQRTSGIDKVHAVVGGWHLAPSPDEIVAQTVAPFKEIDPDYLIPMHCTGWNTIMAI